MKRAIVVVIDSMGIGAMPDCREYNDIPECNTIKNIADKKDGGLNLPTMQILGIGNLCDIKGVKQIANPVGQYGIMSELSKGKDTTTGHWEMAGLVLDVPFRVYPDGFPEEVINKFIEKTGCGGVLGNYPASGTQIIADLNDEHQKTKYPIVYTSADSVFQIAVDTDVIPLDTLYRWCEAAREILTGEHNVSRVIARPYKIIDGKPTRISKDRRDYSVKPPKPTVLNEIGYAAAVEEIDAFLPKIMWAMTPEDMLIVTADHGCDPTVPGTDHTREKVPVLIYGKGIQPGELGDISGFTYVADRIREWLF